MHMEEKKDSTLRRNSRYSRLEEFSLQKRNMVQAIRARPPAKPDLHSDQGRRYQMNLTRRYSLAKAYGRVCRDRLLVWIMLTPRAS